jgi:hypothetical protein
MEIEPKLCETDSFIKKKRSLNIVSILLIFIYFSGATISSVSAQGASLTIQNPSVVNIFLFIMLVYFLYRYWLDLKNNSKFIRDLQTNKTSELLMNYIKKQQEFRQINQDDFNHILVILEYAQTNPFKFWKNIDFQTIQIDSETNSLRYAIIINALQNNIKKLENKKFLFIRWKAFFQSIFLESYFTDYLLSYFLASFAIIVTILDYYKNISEDLTSPFINCL